MPPWNAYSVSHHVQRRGHPVSRTNVQGKPAQVDSPWTEWKISVMRRKSPAKSVVASGLLAVVAPLALNGLFEQLLDSVEREPPARCLLSD